MKVIRPLLFLCTSALINAHLQEPLAMSKGNDVDINRFTQLLSNHLLLAHFDKAYYQLSKKVSLQFRDAIRVKVKKVKQKKTTKTTALNIPVDVQLLKRQIKGAVGCFLEDRLPSILTHGYDTANLQVRLDHLLYQYCPYTTTNQTISQACLFHHQTPFLSEAYEIIHQDLDSTVTRMNQFELPRLFETVRAQIAGILMQLNQHIMDQNQYTLELKLKEQYQHNRHWITEDMKQDFILTVNYTNSPEEQDHIQDLIQSSFL